MDMASIGPLLHAFWTVWLGLLFLGIVVFAAWPGDSARLTEAARLALTKDRREI